MLMWAKLKSHKTPRFRHAQFNKTLPLTALSLILEQGIYSRDDRKHYLCHVRYGVGIVH